MTGSSLRGVVRLFGSARPRDGLLPSNRQLQIGQQIKKILCGLFAQNERFFHADGFAMFSVRYAALFPRPPLVHRLDFLLKKSPREVRLSKDVRTATVWWVPGLHPEIDITNDEHVRILRARLQSRESFLRYEVAQRYGLCSPLRGLEQLLTENFMGVPPG